jgi:trans-L-3-hydroxyproline dehydratase
MAARGSVGAGEWRRFESVTGSIFEGRVAATLTAGTFPAIRAEVAGRAYYTGSAVFTVEPDDPLAGGFLLR